MQVFQVVGTVLADRLVDKGHRLQLQMKLNEEAEHLHVASEY